MLDKPKRIQYWENEPKQLLDTFKFNEKRSLMSFNRIFDIVSVKDAPIFADIIFNNEVMLFDEENKPFSFNINKKVEIEQLFACQLSWD